MESHLIAGDKVSGQVDPDIVSLELVYAWRYTRIPHLAPSNAVQMERISVGNDVVLRHLEGHATEAIWGATKFLHPVDPREGD